MTDEDRPTKIVRSRADSGGHAVQRARLVVVEGPDRGATAEVALGTQCSVGSHENNQLRLDDPTVSRFHCELALDARGLRVRDLDSRNGTSLDGVRVVDAFVRDGGVIVLGRSWIRAELVAATVVETLGPTQFGRLVGRAPGMRAAFAALERAAATDVTVLLEGETGTGKEEAAAALHAAGKRAEGPLIVVDCGAMPRELLLSELFGHEKGAFTGAAERHIGAFEAASGGTIFLDEIGELPLDMQPQLLRVLERREIRRVGSTKYTPIDVRVIAATNRDLRTEVNEDRFRADLYYRLAVVTVRIPPLRERPDDLPELARAVLANLGVAADVIDRLCGTDLLDALRRGRWTGNVRELRNYLERCLVFDQALPVDPSAAPPRPARSSADQPYAAARRAALDQFERTYVRELLANHGGRVQQAAAAAGLGRVQLWRLTKKHGV